MPTTPNLQLDLIEDGASPWGDRARQNLDNTDKHLTRHGAGDPNGAQDGLWLGQTYYDTVTGIRWRCTTLGDTATAVWHAIGQVFYDTEANILALDPAFYPGSVGFANDASPIQKVFQSQKVAAVDTWVEIAPKTYLPGEVVARATGDGPFNAQFSHNENAGDPTGTLTQGAGANPEEWLAIDRYRMDVAVPALDGVEMLIRVHWRLQMGKIQSGDRNVNSAFTYTVDGGADVVHEWSISSMRVRANLDSDSNAAYESQHESHFDIPITGTGSVQNVEIKHRQRIRGGNNSHQVWYNMIPQGQMRIRNYGYFEAEVIIK